MANATITVLEADGTTETDVVVLDVGRQSAAASKSVAASTEDKAVLDAIAASLALLDNSIASGNELQVDVVGALPAGTNAIGKLAANSGVDIGDVDVASIAAGNNVIGQVKITDGTNNPTIKDSAAVGTDMGMVVHIHPDSVNANGQAAMSASAPVVIASNQSAVPTTVGAGTAMMGHVGGTDYEAVAASQTDQMLGASGAAGDYLSHLLVVPATTSPGAVSIEDGSANTTVFTGGASSITNLVPFVIPIGAKSTTGGWEITTGSNVSVIAFGDFT